MTLDELIQATREDILNDTVVPYLWSDSKLTRYANDAVAEACDRAPLIRDTSMTVGVTANQSVYTIDPTVRMINSAILASTNEELTGSTETELRIKYGRFWRDDTGRPNRYVRRDDSFTLYPIPDIDDGVFLDVYRRPLDSEVMVNPTDTPPIPDQYHHDLIFWMAFSAYSVHDSDIYDEQAATKYYNLFEVTFGRHRSDKYDKVNYNTPLYARALPVRFI